MEIGSRNLLHWLGQLFGTSITVASADGLSRGRFDRTIIETPIAANLLEIDKIEKNQITNQK